VLSKTSGKNWVEFNATVEEVELLLDTEYHYYEHESGGFRVACDSYGVPGHVQKHIDFIMPTIHLDGLRPVRNLSPMADFQTDAVPIYGLNGTAVCNRLITIDCLRALYNFGQGNYSNPSNKLGIPEWADYLYYPDLQPFFENFTSPKIPSDTLPEFVSIDGGKPSNLTQAQEGNVIESALDFDAAYSIIWPQNIRQYQIGDGVNIDSVGTFNIFLDALDSSYCTYLGGDQPYLDPEYPDPNLDGYTGPEQCGGAPISNVLTVSYGQIEGALPEFYQQRQCHEWMKLGLQGVSIFFASGDSGVGNRYNAGYNNSCLNAEYGYVDANGTKFSPSFPVNCPYITAGKCSSSHLLMFTRLTFLSEVGGTQLNGSVDVPEVAASFSGGGFSNIFPMPDYQKSAVTHYLENHTPTFPEGTVWNNTGKARAYPDVSAIGRNVTTIWMGQAFGVGGTSASSPIVASIVNLINEERLHAGKSPVGFVNPVFYANPDMFNDILVGHNPGCGTNGFTCAPGWDPVTGLGTPNYEKMKKVFLDLP
jgi:tripeptidyl-peptidase-1